MFKEREREGFGFHELSDKIDKINKEQASNEQLLFNIVHKENKNENN